MAAAAGVSTATVSRVMSGRGYVSPATRQTVLESVTRLGYRPSASARSLRTARTASLGVLVPNLANAVFLPFLRGVEHVAEEHGYAVLIADGRRSAAVERRQLDNLYAHRVEALVVGETVEDPAYLDTLARLGLRVVRAPDAGGEGRGWSSAEIEAPAIAAACARLADLGHRRVAYVLGPSRRPLDGRATARREQVTATLAARGVTVATVALRSDEPPVVAAHVRTLLGRDAPTALVCAAHPLAPTLLRALAETDVAVPDQLSFLTFGDSPWAAAYRPGIAVIRRDAYAEGQAVARRALHEIGALPDPGRPEPPPATFLPRGSLAPPR